MANEALDAAGIDYTLGDLEDGVRYAQVCARKYRPLLGALLRAAHWSFARKQQQLQILTDQTGQLTPNTNTQLPWIYSYALPNDCVLAIYVPWQQSPLLMGEPSTNITPPNPQLPLMSGLAQTNLGYTKPARFLISRDVNFPPAAGQVYDAVQGVSPMGQTVILTNVPQAFLVYTSLVLTPSEWDTEFREAYVAYLASEIAVPLHKDKKFGLAMANRQVQIAKDKISEARAQSANAGWNVNSHFPDWINIRNTGSGWGWGWGQEFGLDSGGIGIWYGAWDSLSIGGAAF